MTPEAKQKSKLHDGVKKFGSIVWWYSVVETGYGTRAVDVLCCVAGRFVAIEVKADNSKAVTPRQQLTLAAIEAAGGQVFVVYDPYTRGECLAWMEQQAQQHMKYSSVTGL